MKRNRTTGEVGSKRCRRAMKRGNPERAVPAGAAGGHGTRVLLGAALPRGMRNCGAGGGWPCLSKDLAL